MKDNTQKIQSMNKKIEGYQEELAEKDGIISDLALWNIWLETLRFDRSRYSIWDYIFVTKIL